MNSINIYIISNYNSYNQINILLSFIIIMFSNYSFSKSNNTIDNNNVISSSLYIFSIFINNSIYSIVGCLFYIISIIILVSIICMFYYIIVELLYEYYSMYFIILVSMMYLSYNVTISELIIIFSISCIGYVSISSINYKGIVDGIILNDNNYIGLIVCIILSIVSNYIIYKWLCNNIYSISINYIIIDLGIYCSLILFIDIQLKEYINYSSYMNDVIYISILFIMLGIHLLHILICILYILYIVSIIINCTYNYCNIYYSILIILFNSIYVINICIYYHLVSLLWYCIIILLL